MKRPQFANNQIYHIYNRGVEKRDVFLEDKDRYRFIHDLFEFNDTEQVKNLFYYFNPKSIEVEPHYLAKERKPRKLLVEILAFVLMPNHFHLLLRQKRENGIVKFMQKLGTGYAMYFNKKNERVGPLFQGKFKAVIIKNHAYLIHLPYYIHLNPLELFFPSWPNYRGSTSLVEMINFLENYRWSSWLDYIGKENFPSVTSREFLLEIFGSPQKYKKDTIEWLKEKNLRKNLEIISPVALDFY